MTRWGKYLFLALAFHIALFYLMELAGWRIGAAEILHGDVTSVELTLDAGNSEDAPVSDMTPVERIEKVRCDVPKQADEISYFDPHSDIAIARMDENDIVPKVNDIVPPEPEIASATEVQIRDVVVESQEKEVEERTAVDVKGVENGGNAVLRQARPIGKIEPSYPRSCRLRGSEGVVEVQVAVSESGEVNGVTVVKSSGVDALDKAAEDAIRRAKFEPAKSGGGAIASVTKITVDFRLLRK